MKILTLILLTIIACVSTSKGSNTGTGTMEVTVEYEAIGVFYNTNDESGLHYQKGPHWGEVNLNDAIGTLYPPPLNECTVTIPGETGKFKPINLTFHNVFIPFYVKGSPGIDFDYIFSFPPSIDGGPGLILAQPVLMGSTNAYPNHYYQQIPPSGHGFGVYTATLDNEGKYYMRLHYHTLYIRSGIPEGKRTFTVTVTCNY